MLNAFYVDVTEELGTLTLTESLYASRTLRASISGSNVVKRVLFKIWEGNIFG